MSLAQDVKKLQKLGEAKAREIDKIIAGLDKTVQKAQPKLFDTVLTGVLENVGVDRNGKILTNTASLNALNSFSKVYAKFADQYSTIFATELYRGLMKTVDLNIPYFSELIPDAVQLIKISEKAKIFINSWLGVEKGSMIQNGYLHKMLLSENVTRQIQDYMATSITTQKGFFETKEGLQYLIEDNPGKNGILKRYYRNFVYDSISVTDRVTADIYRGDLDLQFAIYEGGLIETSRKFCVDHNGKVYHITEIENFKPDSGIPRDGTYNPLSDGAGYGCRHYYNWITDSMALMLREDAKKFIE